MVKNSPKYRDAQNSDGSINFDKLWTGAISDPVLQAYSHARNARQDSLFRRTSRKLKRIFHRK